MLPHNQPSRPRGPSGWAIRSLSAPLLGYLIAVEIAALAATGVAAGLTRWRLGDVLLLAALVACGAAAIEATRRTSEPHGTVVRDMHAVWFIAAAALLPPVYALIAPVPLALLKLWRTPGMVAYRRVFSAAANALAYGCASVAFHALPYTGAGPIADGGAHIVAWTAALAACGLLGLVLNNALLLVAIRLSDREARLRDLALNPEDISTDLLQLGLAVLITVPAGIRPELLAAAVPAVLAQRRFIMHAQLVTESRIDSKTGLLNAVTWQREARVELDRAARTGEPLAVAIADIDHFKAVNDTHGHLTGDIVLATLAAAMRALLREYDIVGRFGGEEFTVLLPHTTADEAVRVAERLREKVAQLTITATGSSAPDTQLSVTISIGLAAVAAARRDLNDLIAAADAALYRAKDAGRNQVRMLTDPHQFSGGPAPVA
jgi:diguanylate cyclase (GGDEF)-like protein